jgi:DNA invertase Pin-like site-specific DNA recombinase
LLFFINERVRNGLANARAKGKKIGRQKTRPSDMIRVLLKSGMSHRKIAATLKISHGSVSLERRSLKEEEKLSAKPVEVEIAKVEPSPIEIDTSNWF